MSTQNFCDACQAFLQGSWRQVDGDHEATLGMHLRRGVYRHHDTATSFQLALGLKCVVCVRLWAGFQRGMSDLERNSHAGALLPTEPTTFETPPGHNGIINCEVKMSCGDLITQLLLGPWNVKAEQVDSGASRNTGDDTALDFLVSQNRRCLAEDPECQQSLTGRNFLPTRVIDVGSEPHTHIRVCERESLTIGRGYVVLSHCWGKVQPVTLTMTTAATLKDGVLITSLPKTFQDAIEVTRRFKHQYIWIDSLCIIQDDPDDWRTESATMREVYSNAAFCIAATAAQDSNTGLFIDRDLDLQTPVKVHITWEKFHKLRYPMSTGDYWLSSDWISAEGAIDAATLNHRAWVAQERYLSHRVLHFAREVVFWECGSHFASETHPKGLPRTALVNYQNGGVFGLKSSIRHHRWAQLNPSLSHFKATDPVSPILDAKEMYSIWCRFRNFYTSCYLTNGDDILVALHGIAQDIGETLQDKMVAGVWKEYLIEELCWHVSIWEGNYRPPSSWQCPSWSWINSTRTVHRIEGTLLGEYMRGDSLQNMATVIDICVDEIVSGGYRRASIVLRCRLIPTNFRYGSSPREKSTLCDTTDELSRCEVVVYPDNGPDQGSDGRVGCYLLLLGYKPKSDQDSWEEQVSIAEGLVIVPSGAQPGCYRRIGYWRIGRQNASRTSVFVYDKVERTDILDSYDVVEEQIVELV